MAINRRKFMKTLFLSIVGLVGFVYLDSFWIEKYIIDWNEFDLSEKPSNKVKIIQLSDLHLHEIKYFHKTIAERINTENPDIIAFTGDTITRARKFPILKELLDLINPEILKIVILGNKEHDGRIPIGEIKGAFSNYNGLVLVNENYVFSKNDRKINIIGVDSLMHGKPDFEKAIIGIDKKLDTIVLNHCPEYSDVIDDLNQEEEINIKMILSGHTHGGQVTFFGKEIYKPDGSGRYLKGWYQNKNTKMYVSKGIGTTALPIRFCARAEAVIFHV